jgi:hypothetical protein
MLWVNVVMSVHVAILAKLCLCLTIHRVACLVSASVALIVADKLHTRGPRFVNI